MTLQAESPAAIAACRIERQLLPFGTLPSGLQQPGGLRCLCCHHVSEEQVGGFMNHHFQFMAAPQQLCPGRRVSFRRKGDPVGIATERVNTAGFQMQGQLAGFALTGAAVKERMTLTKELPAILG